MSDAGEGDQEEPKVTLELKSVSAGLSQIDKTYDGSSYVYTTLNLQERDPKLQLLGDALNEFEHLRNVNLSQNELEDVEALAKMPHLLTVNCQENAITAVEFLSSDEQFKFLQIANFSQNQIKELPSIKAPLLKHLNLSKNQIATCEKFEGHGNLQVLELRGNQLPSCDGLAMMPNLVELYLAENATLKSIAGLKNLPNLKKLHLRACEIEAFDEVPDLPALEYLNMRETKIEKLDEVQKLNKLTSLKTINFLGTPVGDEAGDGFKKEWLIFTNYRKCLKINKEEVTPEDYDEAKALWNEREEERKAKEAEAANAEGEGGE